MDKKKSRYLSILLILSLVIGMMSIINVDTTYAATKKTHLKKTTVTIVAGKTYQQKLINKNGKTIKATDVKWTSKSPSVAKINKKGKITAVKSGTAKMTAKYNGKTYKFTIKVKKPFTSDEKPTLKKPLEYSDGIYLQWSKMKNASKYQLYVSVNGGSYTRIYSGADREYGYFSAKPGKTYSFKVRGVGGKHYSKFSTVKKLKYWSNSSISLNKTSLTLTPGETKTVNVITDNGWSVSYKKSNSNVDCSWGAWIDDTTCKLKITGETLGKTTVTVYDSEDSSVKATIPVTVKTPVTIKAPSLPASYSYQGYNNLSTCSITKVEVVDKYYFKSDKTSTVEVWLYGKKTFDTSTASSSCKVGWKLYDADGYVVDSGTFYSESVSEGEQFKGYIYLSDLAPGTYNLELLNVTY